MKILQFHNICTGLRVHLEITLIHEGLSISMPAFVIFQIVRSVFAFTLRH